MLDIKFIREHTAQVRKSLSDRNHRFDLDGLLASDRERRTLLTQLEKLRAEQNIANKEIGKLQREKQDVSAKIKQMKEISQNASKLLIKVEEEDNKIRNLTIRIPNITHQSTPEGADSSQNKEIRAFGAPKEFQFKPKNHLEIGEKLGVFDFKRAGRISGSGFALFTGKGARLVRGLINFMLDLHTTRHGYQEMWPPSLVNQKSMQGTGQLPNLKEDMYHLEQEGMYLIPTAEVPLTNMYQGETLSEKDLPIRFVAYTPCFRREAGSYGRMTKGLLRVHQFDKVELVKMVHPEDSYEELETLVKDAESVLKALGLPFRTMQLCSGDISFASTKCYDLEAWAAGTGNWLEVSSCSNFEDFQARRIGTRFKPTKGKGLQYIHTLNGSGVALPRTIAALLEYYQEADGSVRLPEVLAPYLGGDTILS